MEGEESNVDPPSREDSKDEEIDHRSLWGFGNLMMIQMSLKVAIELNIFNIIHTAGWGASLSVHDIAAKIPATNPNSIAVLEKLLLFLTSESLLSSSLRPRAADGQNSTFEQTYGLTRTSRHMVTIDEASDAFSIAPIVVFGGESIVFDRLNMLKDAILDPDNSRFFSQRVDLFDVTSRNPSLNKSFNDLMGFWSRLGIRMILSVYKGFEGVRELLDVGGGNGTVLKHIVSAYPHIRGINFDLPHVVGDAPSHQGVEHVGGDMFISLPKAETIWMKAVLHDWDDERCEKILKNCWDALPERGKVIVAEQVVREDYRELCDMSKIQAASEFGVMLMHQNGKERSAEQFTRLAKAGGFAETEFFPIKDNLYIIEFLKQ